MSNALDAAHAARLCALARADRHRPSLFRGAVRVGDDRHPERVRWRASIRTGGRIVRLGTFPNARTAGVVYDLALMTLGFPPVNFTEAEYRTVPPSGSLEDALRVVRARLGLPDASGLPNYRQH